MRYYSKQKFIEGFKRWLIMMNYDQSSIQTNPRRVVDFLSFMEAQGVQGINQISGNKVKQYFDYLSKRKSKITGDVLSQATLRTYLTTINRFAKYLREFDLGNLEVPVQFKGRVKKEIPILSTAEIDLLYETCDDTLLGIRDRAMLAVFYGCGIRRNEGVNLELKDVLPDRNLLFISKGKGNKQRYVPMIGQVKNDIISYLTTARPMLIDKTLHEMFFVGITGNPLKASSLYERFKSLLRKAKIEKKAGLHALRHSIATHLLINGMKLADIAKFLGHSSLESTQIYTHLSDGL